MGNRGTAPLILNLAVDGDECSTSGTVRFSPAKDRRYPLNRQLDGPQRQSGEDKNILLIPVAAQSKAWVNSRSLGIRVRIPQGAWMSVLCSGRGLYVGLITRPEESYRVCVRVLLSVITPYTYDE